MSNQTAREISIALGNAPLVRPLKEGKITSPHVKLNFTEFEKINKAFAPMVRNLAFDVCEMAAVTFFQALEAGKPLRLLPVVLLGSLHHGSLFYDPANGPLTPSDLKGRRVAVRAYSQTTGMWVRGILQEQYGVSSDDVTWVTLEDAHVAEYKSPANVEKRENANLVDMLRADEASAVIIGPKHSAGLGLQQLIPDVGAASAAWYQKHKTVPINHMVVVTEELLEKDPTAVKEIYNMLKQGFEQLPPAKDGAPMSAVAVGLDQIWESGALQLAMQYSVEQKLISRVFDKNELFINLK